jgi:hypothetical protein
MFEDLANIWISCGCLFLLAIVFGALVLGVLSGGNAGIISLVLLGGIGAYLVWAHQSNQPRR